jgi:ribosomal protein L37AE/L43A
MSSQPDPHVSKLTKPPNDSELEWLLCLASAYQASQRGLPKGPHRSSSPIHPAPRTVAKEINAALACPRCTSSEIRRSRSRGVAFERFLLPLLNRRPYRCMRCEKRFYSRIGLEN